MIVYTIIPTANWRYIFQLNCCKTVPTTKRLRYYITHSGKSTYNPWKPILATQGREMPNVSLEKCTVFCDCFCRCTPPNRFKGFKQLDRWCALLELHMHSTQVYREYHIRETNKQIVKPGCIIGVDLLR